jgi:pimeloyl-ACP methyl ester carboxylesterase
LRRFWGRGGAQLFPGGGAAPSYSASGESAENHRLIAFDLPGHGQFSNAPDPTRSYTLPGLADAAVELLEKLGVTEAIVFVISLGGHIGIEMVPRFPEMRGLMISGSPPVGRNKMAQGLNASAAMGVAGKQDLSEAEIEGFVQAIFGESAEPFLSDAVARAAGRFRKEALRGRTRRRRR